MSLSRSLFTSSLAKQVVSTPARAVSQSQAPRALSTLRPSLALSTPAPSSIPTRIAVPSHLLASPRTFSTSLRRYEDQSVSSEAPPQKGTPIGQIEQRLQLTFTCTVDECGHRSTHEFAKRSYEKGIVIVECPGCKNRHLIADHLSWFTETPDEPKTVEQMVAEKGGRVRTGRKTSGLGGVDGDQGETIEILSDSEADALEKSVQEQEAQQQQQQ